MSGLSTKKLKSSLRVWSDALNEENLCESLTGLSNTEKKLNEEKQRGVESYNFKDAKIRQSVVASNPFGSTLNETNKSNEEPAQPKAPVKDRIGAKVFYDESKPRLNVISELDSEELVTKQIAKLLKEPNDDIIKRCVHVLGKKKAIELLYATQDIMDRGGMLTNEGNRKRSPGGIYLQLVKRDDTILGMQRKQIFIEDAIKKKEAKKIKRLRQRRRMDDAKKKLEQQVNGITTSHNKQQPSNVEQEEIEELDEISEENMIYFDE